MTNLAAAILTVRPLEVRTLPRWTGSHLRLWFLEQIAQHDTSLAERLQQGDDLRPYTISSLIGARRSGRESAQVIPDEAYTIRITTLDTRLTQCVSQALLAQWPNQPLVIGDAAFVIESATVDPAHHLWAGTTTDAAFVQQYTLNVQTPSRYVTLDFDSPTAFKHQTDHVIPFPLPEFVFGSLLTRWNTFNDVQLHPDARRFAEECVAANRHRLHMSSVRLVAGEHELFVTGFTGHCRYVLLRGDRYWCGVLHTLAAYAFFAGVGIYSTMGMGRVAVRATASSGNHGSV